MALTHDNEPQKMEMKHSEDFAKCHTLEQFQNYRQELLEIIATNRRLQLAISAWEKELEDVDAEIKKLEDQPKRTWY